MEAPPLNPRPGRVIEAEVLRRFRSPINFVPFSLLQEFFLVLSVGRCKLYLTTQSVEALLQSVLGGHSHAFRVVQLGDRVFRFSVSSKSVGLYRQAPLVRMLRLQDLLPSLA